MKSRLRPLAAMSLLMAMPLGSGPLTRALTGRVTDKRGNALPGAAVEVENTGNLQIASYLTRKDGKYYFHDLSTDVDYTLRAKYKRWWSGEKRLSKFNGQREATIDLVIPIE